MAKIGGGSGKMPEYKTQKKSLKAEKLLAEAIKKNPEAKTANAPIMAEEEKMQKVAQFMFENGGRWPDKSIKEGYSTGVDPAQTLLMYKAMVEESALQQMAEQSDMKTQEKMQFFNPDQQKSFQEKSAEFLRNM